MSERLGPLPEHDLTDAQRAVAREVSDGPRGAVYGPFIPLLRSPELMMHAQRMGEYLRYRSALGVRLSELAILVTARRWDQQVEWAIHAPIAVQAGIPAAVIAAIAARERPGDMLVDETVVHDFCVQLHEQKAVSDAVYADALALFGEQGLVDLVGICGYYALLAMVMNVARTPVAGDAAWRLPD